MNVREVHPHERGQSLVELAVGMVFLLVLLVGVVNVGHYAFSIITLQDYAQEAAVFASVNPRSCTKIANRALPYGETSAYYDIQVLIDGVDCEDASERNACAGKQAEVRLTDPEYPIFTPFVGMFFDSQTLTMTVSAKSTILNPDCP